MSDYIQDIIRQRLDAAFQKRKNHKPYVDWAHDYLVLENGERFSFKGHAYLEELYTLHHPYIVYEKAAQTCVSTKVLGETFWGGDGWPLTALYYFPTDGDVEDFSNHRAKSMIKDSPYLSEKVTGIDNVGQKQIGMSWIYFRGLWTKTGVKSVPADILVLDELVEANLENAEFAKDRLLHSRLAWIRELSQPGLPGFGIDESFEKSDQRYWLLKCPHCGQWTNVVDTFPECLGVVGKPRNLRYFLACVKCGKDLDTQAGEWVAKYPDRKDVRGYQVSQLYSSIVPEGYSNLQEYIYKEWKSARKQRAKKRIIISIVGRPYADDTLPLNEQNIKPALGTHPLKSRSNYSIMGIDVGDELYIVILSFSNDYKLLIHWLEITDDWNRLDKLMVEQQVAMCVIEAMPYKNSAKNFARRYPDNVYIMYLNQMVNAKKGLEGEGVAAVKKISEDRTDSLDQTVCDFKEGEMIIPDRTENEKVETFIQHLFKLKKEKKLKEDGSITYVYKKRQDNHFAFAANAARIGVELLGEECGLGLIPTGASIHDH